MSAPPKRKKGTPSDVNQWASEAFDALEKGLISFEMDYPNPSEEDRLELIGYAAEIAAGYRGITDSDKIDQADEYAVDNVLADLEEQKAEEPEYTILFLLCYLDANVAFGALSEKKLQPVMEALIANFDLSVE